MKRDPAVLHKYLDGSLKCSRVSLEISPNHLGEERPGEDGRRIPELNLGEGGGLGPVAQALFAS